MKRVLLAVVLAMVWSSMVRAHYYRYRPFHYRAYYSPYVGGLVPADIKYSPYAFDYYHSGLVPYWVEYSPYAFSHQHPSGLIDSWSGRYWQPPVYYQRPLSPEKSYEEMRREYEEYLQMRQERLEKQKQARTAEESGKDAICRFLQERGIEFQLRNGFRIRDRLLSCEFLLKGGDLIKYWNTAAIAEMTQHPRYAQVYQKYIDNWLVFKQEYKGGKVYEIEIAN